MADYSDVELIHSSASVLQSRSGSSDKALLTTCKKKFALISVDTLYKH